MWQFLAARLQDLRLRVRAVYVGVLVLGMLFSVLVIAYSDETLNASRRLIRDHGPALSHVAALKSDAIGAEARLYEYYATGDREPFLRDRIMSEGRRTSLLAELEEMRALAPRLAEVRARHARLERLAGDLDHLLLTRPFDAPTALALLDRVSVVGRELIAELDVLADLIGAGMHEAGTKVEENVQRMAQLAILFSMAMFLIAVVLGHHLNTYLREYTERRRLAVFVERNPNPVMRLSLAGEVIYANSAAEELARRMGHDGPRAILPIDLPARLKALRAASERYQVWNYERDGRSFEGGIHFLPDLGSFHAYVTDATERRLTEEKLLFQAYHHPLTGLPNRRMFQQVAEQAFAPAGHAGVPRAAVFLLGLDRFKVVIDTLGHDIGDQLLKACAARLKSTLETSEAPGSATLYHFDGDLFAVLLVGLGSEQGAVLLAEKLIGANAQPLYLAGREFYASFSIGIALHPGDGENALALLKNADTAMHRVKRRGGRGFQLYKPEMNAMAVQWMALESYLRHAIEHDELRVHYQPQVDVRTGRQTGTEALLRWEHPQHGLLTPSRFITLAEESGLIVPIGEWVLRTVCAQARRWREGGLLRTPIAVNISARQFAHDLPALVRAALRETGLAPEGLELEITESVAMQDVARSVEMLRELKSMGVRLAIDDFGTGFSSLASLRRFPIDKLKVDRSFVVPAGDDTDVAILRAIASLGHALKLRVVAEGVETSEQLARVRTQECDAAQGALYGLPMPPAAFEAWLTHARRAVS